MRVKLSDICTVKAGHPFRGKIPEQPEGDALAVQIRDVSDDGDILWDQVIHTDIKGRKSPDWLRDGHVLFIARGQKNNAALVVNAPSKVVCAPHFFLLEVRDEAVIAPSFLAWQLNQADSQRYFAIAAQGTAQVNVTRAHLEATTITVPPMDKQVTIVKLYQAAIAEKKLHMAFIENRAKQLTAIAHEIMSEA
ncbi:hypothetical protein A3735_07575 [Oleiphilus sp. HI0061]|uniref:restriction endonuclease subunit S n=1 Tax=Oleiphilus sp. HI0061 TaxID=1822239 RepID=UPI0007CF4B91|nr:restriction endonuclease subunit S [Oleiphilus sp. HI0061]KZY65924.1 hypothetical protein A3735_07575 [Oleiphilus sp. HI0061]